MKEIMKEIMKETDMRYGRENEGDMRYGRDIIKETE